MIHDGRVLGLPLVDYTGAQADIESLADAEAGMTAFASDVERWGYYDGTNWQWFDTPGDYLTEAEHTAIGNSSPHHAPVTLGTGSDPALSLSGQQLTLANVLTPDEHTAIGNSSPHHAPVTLGTGSDPALSLSGQQLTLANVLTPDEHTAIGNSSPHHAPVTLGTGSDPALSLNGQQLTLRKASEAQTGVVELATVIETKSGIDTERAVTPVGMAGVVSLVTPASDGKLQKSGAGVLTLAASANHTLTVPATGAAVLRDAGTGLTAGCIPFASDGNTVTNDSSLFWDNTNKRLGIGTQAPRTHLDIYSNTATLPRIMVRTEYNHNDMGGIVQLFHNRAAGSLPVEGDGLGALIFGSYDGGTERFAASMMVKASENWVAGTRAGTFITFHTTPLGTITRTERMQITSGGSVLIGTKTDGMTANGSLAVAKDFAHRGSYVGFYNATPVTKQTVSGSKGGNAALASLLSALAALGLITNSTT